MIIRKAKKDDNKGIANKLIEKTKGWFDPKKLKYHLVSTDVKDTEANRFWKKQGVE